jgi:hypothetical protein
MKEEIARIVGLLSEKKDGTGKIRGRAKRR